MLSSLFSRCLFFLSFFVILSLSVNADEQIPKHLEAGRILVSTLAPENTSYRYNGWVKWKGDPLTPYSEAHTDCSGLVSSLLERTGCSMNHRLKLASSKAKHPKAADYFDFIAKGDGFKRINLVTEVLPGDIIAVKYNAGSSARMNSNTGHVMLVDAAPGRRVKDTKPVIQGTTQWEVMIIDSTAGPHGRQDSRHQENGLKRNGVGRGLFRLYVDEAGTVVGYTWSTHGKSVYYDSTTRPLAIGRPLCHASSVAGKDVPQKAAER